MPYFNYGHLPVHLQPISKPFHDVATQFLFVSQEISDENPIPYLRDALCQLVKFIQASKANDPDEAQVAIDKLDTAIGKLERGVNLDQSLRLLLESKDCAVRAGLTVTDLKPAVGIH
jgi:hypothetical protein